MAFIVEDGTGLTDANSYASVQEYRDYAELRNIDVTSELDATIQGYLVRATDYLELTYEYLGEKLTETQMLEFPRLIDYEDTELPLRVKNATIEMAFEQANGATIFKNADKNITSIREKVDVIETEKKYNTEMSLYETAGDLFPIADKLVKPYVSGTNNKGQIPTSN